MVALVLGKYRKWNYRTVKATEGSWLRCEHPSVTRGMGRRHWKARSSSERFASDLVAQRGTSAVSALPNAVGSWEDVSDIGNIGGNHLRTGSTGHSKSFLEPLPNKQNMNFYPPQNDVCVTEQKSFASGALKTV